MICLCYICITQCNICLFHAMLINNVFYQNIMCTFNFPHISNCNTSPLYSNLLLFQQMKQIMWNHKLIPWSHPYFFVCYTWKYYIIKNTIFKNPVFIAAQNTSKKMTLWCNYSALINNCVKLKPSTLLM